MINDLDIFKRAVLNRILQGCRVYLVISCIFYL